MARVVLIFLRTRVAGYPFDVIKTRVQCVRVEAPSAGGRQAVPPFGIVATARTMAGAEGMGVFYRGLGLKLARAVPMSMIGFFAYEVAAKQLRAMLAAPSLPPDAADRVRD